MEPRPSLALPFSKARLAGAWRGSHGQIGQFEAGVVFEWQFLHPSSWVSLVWAFARSERGREFAAGFELASGGPIALISIRPGLAHGRCRYLRLQ